MEEGIYSCCECGKPVKDEDIVCPYCGISLEEVVEDLDIDYNTIIKEEFQDTQEN